MINAISVTLIQLNSQFEYSSFYTWHMWFCLSPIVRTKSREISNSLFSHYHVSHLKVGLSLKRREKGNNTNKQDVS